VAGQIGALEDLARLRERAGQHDLLLAVLQAFERAFERYQTGGVDGGYVAEGEHDDARRFADGGERAHGVLGGAEEQRPGDFEDDDAGRQIVLGLVDVAVENA